MPNKGAVIERPVKVDDNTLAVDRTQPAKTETKHYDYGFLKTQRAAIQKQSDDFVAARQAELDEVDALIAAADKLGIVAKPPEPPAAK